MWSTRPIWRTHFPLHCMRQRVRGSHPRINKRSHAKSLKENKLLLGLQWQEKSLITKTINCRFIDGMGPFEPIDVVSTLTFTVGIIQVLLHWYRKITYHSAANGCTSTRLPHCLSLWSRCLWYSHFSSFHFNLHISGFNLGAACHAFIAQVPSLLGVKIPKRPSQFFVLFKVLFVSYDGLKRNFRISVTSSLPFPTLISLLSSFPFSVLSFSLDRRQFVADSAYSSCFPMNSSWWEITENS